MRELSIEKWSVICLWNIMCSEVCAEFFPSFCFQHCLGMLAQRRSFVFKLNSSSSLVMDDQVVPSVLDHILLSQVLNSAIQLQDGNSSRKAQDCLGYLLFCLLTCVVSENLLAFWSRRCCLKLYVVLIKRWNTGILPVLHAVSNCWRLTILEMLQGALPHLIWLGLHHLL